MFRTGYGEGGIRTLVKVTPKQHFQCCAFNHSATSPIGVTVNYNTLQKSKSPNFLAINPTNYIREPNELILRVY